MRAPGLCQLLERARAQRTAAEAAQERARAYAIAHPPPVAQYRPPTPAAPRTFETVFFSSHSSRECENVKLGKCENLNFQTNIPTWNAWEKRRAPAMTRGGNGRKPVRRARARLDAR